MKKPEIKKMWNADQRDGTYRNPILYTDYSDPDAIRVEGDYFMVASSFCNAPAVPVLHSKDLINWHVINYCMKQLPCSSYEKPRHGCGAWAPAIRFHEGVYYVFIPMPDEGIVMCKTTDPWGEWSAPQFVKQAVGWIDPCPFWDDDGKVYMVSAFAKSRIGFKCRLYLSRLAPDCSEALDDGVFIYDGYQTQPTIEGPKLYKRNGYYYIFAPAGGVATGWQTVLRARDIYGPYEERVVMRQGSTPINGPHQGAWVDTCSGEDWFIHFQDVGNVGRILHLQPMEWVDDWPVIGADPAHTGCGEPVLHFRKPDVGKRGLPDSLAPDRLVLDDLALDSLAPDRLATDGLALDGSAVDSWIPDSPDDSDFFDTTSLGLQWQWNANYKDEWFQLDNGLTLFAQRVDPAVPLCDISNLLLQKWPAPEFTITACLHLDQMKDGDMGGMVSLGGCYTALAVAKQAGRFKLVQRTGELEEDNELRSELGYLAQESVYLMMRVEEQRLVSFAYSIDGDTYVPIGNAVTAAPGKWVGVKVGLFAVNEMAGAGGAVKADYFLFGQLR